LGCAPAQLGRKMTHAAATVQQAGEMAELGMPIAAIARTLGISRAAVRDWLRTGVKEVAARRTAIGSGGTPCLNCGLVERCPPEIYAYSLGLYLGDGYLSVVGSRAVYRLRITCCNDYPLLMDECRAALEAAIPSSAVGLVRREGCTDVSSYSKHWICFFPQAGPGPKHLRPIELLPWQERTVNEHPRPFLRGLIHSDGCRVINRVQVRGRQYAYPRYFFSNESDDIRMMFGDACDLVGVEWRHNRRNSISVARRRSVALLDEFVGPKS
jgi:hypothetical protein